ncbi:RNA polymerase II subunit B1 CTD phosphatase Rpap2-like [Mytilus californianus]|uniref:RNA polymerase II subunit B1 CTD phosphatase Rpap2-like n=1 Tax=Mytilus californianus TaxID=6549 RepID=UPI0022480805|nr:RNA polymerase II subunit B1 CTD phosphatase Rpap2-like [Mytilus californianus]
MKKNANEKYPIYNKGKEKKTGKEELNKQLEKKKLVEAKIRKQVASEEKAFRIVERLIENPITEEFLKDSCQFIAPHHYEDVVEERAITKTCGYPVCGKLLTAISKQKYHISTKDNKVYDITERKSFCSNHCYKASRYLQNQLSTTPLWSREEERVCVSLLTTNSGLPGVEVVGPIEHVWKEVHKLNKLDKPESKIKSSDDNNKEIIDITRKTADIKLTDEIVSEIDCEEDSDDEKDVEHVCQDIDQTKTNTQFGGTFSENAEIDCKTSLAQANVASCSPLASTPETNSSKGNNQSQTEDKMQHLMKLLDRRKLLLGQLVEIETVSEPSMVQNIRPKSQENLETKSSGQQIVAIDKDVPKYVHEVHEQKNTSISEMDSDGSSVLKNVVDSDNSKTFGKLTATCPRVSKEKDSKSKPGHTRMSSHSVIQLICQSVKTWITTETIEYLQKSTEQDQTSKSWSKTHFEALYQALCKRVDAGEFEIEDIGIESNMDDDKDTRLPIPEFERLKEETKDYANKVQRYFAGELFTEPIEKDEQEKIPVYLPTVDTYDQMQIRRKIVMERLQKVIQDVLSPLKLTLQDVYTEYKEMIGTFSLDSKNILHKPAEWTIINLILLRMLSRKSIQIKKAFLQPSSVAYFKILLGRLGTNLQQIDLYIDDLLFITD